MSAPGGPGALTRGTLTRGLLGAATAVLTVVAVVVGCSNEPAGPSADGPSAAAPPAAEPSQPPPPLTGAPDPASVPPPLWEAGTRGDGDPLANFKNTPYNNVGAPPPSVVDSPNVEGARALRFTMPGGGKRAELEPDFPVMREGDDLYFGLAHFLPADFPVNTDNWQVVAQWKNAGEGSPPIELKIGRGQYVLDGGADNGEYFSQPIGPALTGRQTNIVVHIRFSTDPQKAVVDVWQNGQLRLRNFHPPGGTRYESDDTYFKTGIYRDSSIAEPAELFLNDIRIARSYESASALVGPSSPR